MYELRTKYGLRRVCPLRSLASAREPEDSGRQGKEVRGGTWSTETRLPKGLVSQSFNYSPGQKNPFRTDSGDAKTYNRRHGRG